MVRDNLHSRIVFWLKIIQPILALAILATLFLFSRTPEPGDTLPYADVNVDELARNQRLTAPEYSGVTSDGAALSIRAGVVRPNESGADADGLFATYTLPGGARVDLTAAAGRIDNAAGKLSLTGDVQIVTSTGYRIETNGLDSALGRTDLVSGGEVRVEAPFGHIDAGKMELYKDNAAIPGYLLLFSSGVKLIYQPPRKDAP